MQVLYLVHTQHCPEIAPLMSQSALIMKLATQPPAKSRRFSALSNVRDLIQDFQWTAVNRSKC